MNAKTMKRGRKNMTAEEFFLRFVAVCLIVGFGLIWASQRWDNFSAEVGAYFLIIALGFSTGLALVTIYDLCKWIFNFFKG